MAAAYVGGAALEETFLEVFAVLHDTVKNVGSKAHMFKPILRHLESTLDRLLPMIKDIKLLSQQLDCPEEETLDLIEEMKKGEKLVRKCSKTRWRNYCFKVHYAIKLCKLDEDIARFGQVDLQMQKTTLVQMLCPDDKIEATPSPSAPTPQPIAESESLWMNSHWQKGRLIGRGSFGSVYLATNRETGALCAMKEIELFPDEPKSAECIKQLQQEIKVLSQLKHPNIVQYYGSEIVDDRFFIYLVYVHPGSIDRYVHEYFGTITESIVCNFTRHILSGDIRGANLLVDSSGVLKLADFGMAKHLTEQAADLSLKGSPCWMAPEVAAIFKVLHSTPPIPETLSSEGKDFLRCCFQRLPEERPSAAMLLEHPFVKKSEQLDGPSCN
ncbi:mitogen-activated protein kinase kinase kinase 5 [Quercus suber]|uniref:mitogen-activated protein kinase kinase kinase n=1 Tax=Quercus suber TaxID=58331 RepID=A0AAW0LIG4_QUESU